MIEAAAIVVILAAVGVATATGLWRTDNSTKAVRVAAVTGTAIDPQSLRKAGGKNALEIDGTIATSTAIRGDACTSLQIVASSGETELGTAQATAAPDKTCVYSMKIPATTGGVTLVVSRPNSAQRSNTDASYKAPDASYKAPDASYKAPNTNFHKVDGRMLKTTVPLTFQS